MDRTSTTLLKIRRLHATLKGSNRRIAEQLMASPQLLMSQRVSDVAAVCSCDAAQVVRFCQHLGFSGFAELKAQLAQELIPLRTERNYDRLKKSDLFGQLCADYCHNIEQTLRDTVSQLNKRVFNNAVKALHGAGRIVLCGAGASLLAAQDMQSKLFRMGLNASCFDDIERQKIGCALLGTHDFLVAFSFSGAAPAVVECIRVAADNGAKSLLVTNFPDAPAAASADWVLLTAAAEDKLRVGAMASRMAQLAIVDLLVSALALKHPGDVDGNILKTHQVINRP